MNSLEQRRKQRELQLQLELEELERRKKEREEKRRKEQEEIEKQKKELQEKRRARLADPSGSLSPSGGSSPIPVPSSRRSEEPLQEQDRSKQEDENEIKKDVEQLKGQEEEKKKKEREEEEEKRRRASVDRRRALFPSSRSVDLRREIEKLKEERERLISARAAKKRQDEGELLLLGRKLEAQRVKCAKLKKRNQEERKKIEEIKKQREGLAQRRKEEEEKKKIEEAKKLKEEEEAKEKEKEAEKERLKKTAEDREKERLLEIERRKERERNEFERFEAEKREREERDRARKEQERLRREAEEAERDRLAQARRERREREKREREEKEREEREKEQQEAAKRERERQERLAKEKLEKEAKEALKKDKIVDIEKQQIEEKEAKKAIEEREERRQRELEEEAELYRRRMELTRELDREKRKKEREEERERIRKMEEERKRKAELKNKAMEELVEEDPEIRMLKEQMEKLRAEAEEVKKMEQEPKATDSGKRHSHEKKKSGRMDEEDLLAILSANMKTTSSGRSPRGLSSGRSNSGGKNTSSGRSNSFGRKNSSGRLSSASSREKAVASKEKKCPVLIQLAGEKKIHVRRCETVASVINYTDVFLLDAGDKIYQWNGPFSHRNKRAKGVDVADAINKRQRGSGAELIIIDAQVGEEDETPKEFWAILGGKPETIPDSCGISDARREQKWTEGDKLYRVNPGGELFHIEGSLMRSRLTSNFVYVLDCNTEAYVWCGKETDSGKREEAVRAAKKLFLKIERPHWSILRKIHEGNEPVLFMEKFTKWDIPKSDSKPSLTLTVPEPVRDVKKQPVVSEEDLIKAYDKKFTYDQLLNGDFPASIDITKKEFYLSDPEFEQIFNMKKEAFYKQPAWKIRAQKIQARLF